MCGLLALLFIVIPAVEIYLIITVGGWIGALPTFGIIIATGMAGAALARQQGLATVQRLQQSMTQLNEVGRSMVEAALVLVAGVMMLTPGFLTDIVGILLLVPPVRAVVAGRIVVYGRERMKQRATIFEQMGGPGGYPGPGGVGFSAGFGGDPSNETDETDETNDAEPVDVSKDPPPPGVIDV